MPSQWRAVEAGTDLLAHARRIQRSWDRLLGEGALGPDLPPQATTGMRPTILESWRRVLATGLDPTDLMPSIEADRSETQERWLEHPLGSLRHVLVEQLQRWAQESNSLVQVTDPSGLTLYLGGPDWLKERAAEMNLVEGARCSETVNGTNGVGTALAVNHPVQVFAFEHFSHHHREWVCSGAPIHDLVSGRLVGVIDLSSPWKIAHPRSLELVTDAARATEQCLLEGRRDQDARLRRRYGDLTTKSTDLLVNREGHVLVGDDSAHPQPLDVPESGGEIAMEDGSLAIAEPLGQGEAYLVRRLAPRRAGAARSQALERAEERARELATEQAALRHLATLVAYESSPERLVAVAVEQVARVFDVPLVRLIRYAPDAAVVVGGFSESDDEPFPIGSRWQLDTPGLLATIRHTGRAARVEDYAQTPSDGAGAVRAAGMRSAVGSPIVVGGRVWGAIVLLSPRRASLPADTGARLADFTELVATALANSDARTALSQLADEQAALRRVATLVAEGASSDTLFAAVASEVRDVLDIPVVGLHRFEGDGTFTTMGIAGKTGFTVDMRWPVEDEGVAGMILATGRPARKDDYATMPGPLGDAMRDDKMISTVGVPIVVEGAIWGFMVGVANAGTPIPDDTEKRFARFTALVATAIANTNARLEVSRMAEEQAALRRVATLVARGVGPTEVFEAVSSEVAGLFGAEAGVARFEPDGAGMVLVGLSEGMRGIPIGTRWPLEDYMASTDVHRTGRAARRERSGWEDASGPAAEALRQMNPVSMVAAPIVVEGDLWGAITVADTRESLPANAEERIEKFTGLVATAIANTESRAALATSEARARDLAEEQAALRRVATLVAEGASPAKLFSAVAEEVAGLFEPAAVTLNRYDDDVITVLAASGIDFPVGSRWPLDVDSLGARVHVTGRPVHVPDYTDIAGAAPPEIWERHPSQSDLGVPIVVDGRLWGVFCVGTPELDRNPSDTAKHIGRFTELVATAIANSEARDGLRHLLDEQAALRRVATLVAEGASSDELFAAVTREAADVLDVPVVALQRYEPDRMFTMVAIAGETSFTVGSRWPVEDEGLGGMILATGRPARKQDYTTMPAPLGAALRDGGIVSAVGVPIVVEGSIWGFMTAGARPGKPTPDGTEERLARFTELVATAIADSQAREQLAQLADEQAALRQVATLVARGVRPEVVFSAVSEEVGRLFGTDQAAVARFDPDGPSMVVVGATKGIRGASIGTRWPLEDFLASSAVYRTGRPARVEKREYDDASGAVADTLREIDLVSSVAAPIVVEGELWGVMTISGMHGDLPPGAEQRLEKFTELVGTAIANAHSRAELAASEAWARSLADEQAALRRVATLVARGANPEEIFSATAQEVADVLGVQFVTVVRHDTDGGVVLSSAGVPLFAAGSRWPLDIPSLPASVYMTRGPVRIDDFTDAEGLNAIARDEAGVKSAVGVPIIVDGAVWASINTASTQAGPYPADAEERLARFADLIATAVSNAAMRGELAASRARVIAAADESRRRIERDLHDGAQQQLVTLAVALQRAQARIPSALGEVRADVGRVADGLTGAVNELRDLSRGIHPAILTEGGLSPALKALGRRSEVRVKLEVGFEHRLPDRVEIAAYYTVSEALTNASKHANAARVWVSLRVEDDMLRLSIRDDGVGGADANRGSGLTGLRDRVEALGGRIQIESPSGSGTLIEVEIPIAGPADPDREPDDRLAQATTPGSPE